MCVGVCGWVCRDVWEVCGRVWVCLCLVYVCVGLKGKGRGAGEYRGVVGVLIGVSWGCSLGVSWGGVLEIHSGCPGSVHWVAWGIHGVSIWDVHWGVLEICIGVRGKGGCGSKSWETQRPHCRHPLPSQLSTLRQRRRRRHPRPHPHTHTPAHTHIHTHTHTHAHHTSAEKETPFGGSQGADAVLLRGSGGRGPLAQCAGGRDESASPALRAALPPQDPSEVGGKHQLHGAIRCKSSAPVQPIPLHERSRRCRGGRPARMHG